MGEILRDPLVTVIIGAAIEVHKGLGPGLLESAYQSCLTWELVGRGLRIATQVPLPLTFKGARIDCSYRLDLVVEDCIIVEVKSVEKFLPIHTAQVLTYLRLSGARQALLLNFSALTLRAGLRSYLAGRNDPTPAWTLGEE